LIWLRRNSTALPLPAIDEGRVVLVDSDALGPAQIIEIGAH
jgi:hypothetical protein